MITFTNKYKTINLICNICHRTYKTQDIRVRFAPSPTGFLHLGGLRTALYNFLFAKKHGGKFVLRIEDTDQTRLVSGATKQLQEDLEWSGIQIDEGPSHKTKFGPYLQSERLDLYRNQIQVLLENGAAYRCFCTDRRLNLLRKEALKQQEIPKYDNRCRHLTSVNVKENLDAGKPFCVRFKLSDKNECFNDLIYGDICVNLSLSEGDPVILKSDGYPTYHFANVVDDHFMEVSHVFRGVEWQISTPKHILLYKAFNWTPPYYGHLPLLLNSDGTKLSKRQGDIKIKYYKESGIFPRALINFIVHSGGGFTKDLVKNVKPTCYSMNDLIQQFDVSLINSHSGKIMPERLLEFNKLELINKIGNDNELDLLVKEVKDILISNYPDRVKNDTLQYDYEHIKSVLKWSVNRISKLNDLVSPDLEFLWFLPDLNQVIESDLTIIGLLKNRLETEIINSKDDINKILKEFCTSNGVKFGKFMKLLRYALSGLQEGPGIAEMILILGKKSTLERLDLYTNKTKVLTR